MPDITTSEFPLPRSWEEFEDIVWDLYARIWLDPNAQRNGRSGQRQNGVDIFGRAAYLNDQLSGIQCKRYSDGNLSITAIKDEINKAESFQPSLAEFIIATTEHRNAKLQQFIREINTERVRVGSFRVRLIFWEDICRYLSHPQNHDLIRQHYQGWQNLFAQSNEEERKKHYDIASNWDGETRMRYYDLSERDLSECNLENADLNWSNLQACNLSGANLANAKLKNTNLQNANLEDAYMRGASLEGANLAGVNLRGASLFGVRIDETTNIDDKWHLIYNITNHLNEDRDLKGADFRKARFVRPDLNNCDLENADFRGANLGYDANLNNTNLQKANLQKAQIRGTGPTKANLRNSDLRNADLSEAILGAVDLSGANLTMANLRQTSFSFVNLCGANLSNTNLDEANITIVEYDDHTVWPNGYDINQFGFIHTDRLNKDSGIQT